MECFLPSLVDWLHPKILLSSNEFTVFSTKLCHHKWWFLLFQLEEILLSFNGSLSSAKTINLTYRFFNRLICRTPRSNSCLSVTTIYTYNNLASKESCKLEWHCRRNKEIQNIGYTRKEECKGELGFDIYAACCFVLVHNEFMC